MMKFSLFVFLSFIICSGLFGQARKGVVKKTIKNKNMEIVKTDEEWKKILTPQQYDVTRHQGTERPFTGEYYNSKEHGIYQCICCANDLFSSDTKFNSGTGWPSFWAPISEKNVEEETDVSYGM